MKRLKRKKKKQKKQEMIIEGGQFFVDIMPAGTTEYESYKVERVTIKLASADYEVDFRIDKNRLNALHILKSSHLDNSGIVVIPCVSNVIEIK